MIQARSLFLTALMVVTAALAGTAAAGERFITVASTTSTRNSGLYDHLLPMFTAKSGIKVRVVAVGTGQAIRLARAGDADVLLVHHRAGEEKFVADGYGVERFDLMYNDFVLVGPAADPAGIKSGKDVAQALKRLTGAGAVFVSRGDDSGTHRKELTLWKSAGVDPSRASGKWYREAGAGMGATLNTASAMAGHTLSDRGTWLNFRNKGDLAILVEGDKRMFNPYGVIAVNPAKHPHVKAADAQAFIDWLISADGQRAIAAYTINGQPAFFPSARPTN